LEEASKNISILSPRGLQAVAEHKHKCKSTKEQTIDSVYLLLSIYIHTFKMIKDMIDKQVLELKKLWQNKRQLLFQVLNLAMIVFSALMIWKGLMFVTKVRTFVHYLSLCVHHVLTHS
jgi:hypothetical protein